MSRIVSPTMPLAIPAVPPPLHGPSAPAESADEFVAARPEAQPVAQHHSDVRAVFLALLQSDHRADAMSLRIHTALQSLHSELRSRGLLGQDDATAPSRSQLLALPVLERADLLAGLLARRCRDALEAALKYYGVGPGKLPVYSDFDADPEAAGEVVRLQSSLWSQSMTDVEVPNRPDKYSLWAIPRANVQVERKTRYPHPQWKSICEAYVEFRQGGLRGPAGAVAFVVPLVTLSVQDGAPDAQNVKVSSILPPLAASFAKRGRLRFERDPKGRLALLHTSNNRVQRLFNGLHLPQVGRALVRS